MTAFQTLDDVDVKEKRVLVRVDLNVPMEHGEVTDDTRLKAIVPTIREIAKKEGKVILLAHFGRPKGKRDPKDSLMAVAGTLSRYIGKRVTFADDCIGGPAERAVGAMNEGDVVLLENTRYHPGEEKNDPAFAKALAKLGDIYVNDAFSAAHRAHASTEGVAQYLPAAAGRLMQAELEALTKALEKPERPVAAVVGGAKISTKLDLLGNLVKKVDMLALGGGMANTFLFAQGVDVGASLCEKDMADQARAIMETAKAANCELLLPKDFIVAKEFKTGAAHRAVPADGIGADEMALDVGPETVEFLGLKLQGAKTVVWNGPLGAFEIQPFDAGTNAVAGLVAERTSEGGLLSVAGGGDTVSALAHAGVEEKFTYISAAGGAFLEWLEGKDLPGVAALKKK